MKKVFLILTLMGVFSIGLVVNPLKAQTSFFVEQNVRYHVDGESFIPTTTMGGKSKINEKWSHGFFALTTTSWAQVLYGFSYAPIKNLSLGLKVGFEQNQPQITPRVEPHLFLKVSKISLLTIFEKGKGSDNYWWTSHLLYHTKNISFGAMSRRYFGTGGQIVFRINKNFEIWGGALYDFEFQGWKPAFSVKLKF